MGDCLEGANMLGSEGSNNDPELEGKHKIFLSHSGAQKEFVEHLCKALEDRFHYPFFDRRHESLPKGERFPELIVQAAKQCEMLIVVVSNEYFMSKWPMIELSTFVKAHELHHGSKNGPKILPLFYGLSLSDLDDEGMQKQWFQEWETLAKVDSKNRIVVSDWKNALNVLKSFNGHSYDKNLKEVVAYEERIVLDVCRSIAPDIRWDDSHVQGKSNICKVIGEKIKRVGISQEYKVKVVGVYGVGGIGKTTTCKTLCNELSSKFEGRVCHVELPSVSSKSDSKELFQKVLGDLTRKSVEVIRQLDEMECKGNLKKSLFKQRTFLAFDNISDNQQCVELMMFLSKVHHHKDSLVVLTARSQSVLEYFGINQDACLEMPDLGEEDAMKLFLHHAAHDNQVFDEEEKHDIMTCIKRCYFSKGNDEGHHYHPLALRALGLQLRSPIMRPCDWVKKLPRVRTFNSSSDGNPVFDILRTGFDMLESKDQTLFMDLGCFSTLNYFYASVVNIEWLCDVHNQDEEELTFRLKGLKQKGLLQDVDWSAKTVSMHDLYLQFARLEANGSFKKSSNLRKREWVQVESGDLKELERKPEGQCWPKLIRLTVLGDLLAQWGDDQVVGRVGGMERIKWDYFSNVEVLQLFYLHWGHGALHCEGLRCLTILELCGVSGIIRIAGLENLNHLTYFRWEIDEPKRPTTGAHIVGQLPSSLRRLYIKGWHSVVLKSGLFAQCYNLSKLKLEKVEALSLDLRSCGCLESVTLYKIRKLKALSGLGVSRPSNLQSLKVDVCQSLVDIPGLNHLIGLKELIISGCPKYKVPNLLALTELQHLSLGDHLDGPVVPAKDFFPHQLRELHWQFRRFQVPNLTGFNQLEVLSLYARRGFRSLEELGDLPALRVLNLAKCDYLLQLPDLSASTNLTKLDLTYCSSLELDEEDIDMLCELPLLQPVHFSGHFDRERVRLDFARKKVLVHSRDWPPDSLELWKEGEWEERDLGVFPITIGGQRGEHIGSHRSDTSENDFDLFVDDLFVVLFCDFPELVSSFWSFATTRMRA